MSFLIYRPARTATQSGRANTRLWIGEYQPEEAKHNDFLMGWVGSGDMKSQIKLSFETMEDAIAYADRNGVPYEVLEPNLDRKVPKSYADNFRFNKVT